MRVEPAKQRTQTDKYVTVLETGTANTEVDFNTQSLLPMSADHYKVGVDELVVSLSNLSIIEQTSEVLFEIRPVTRTLNVADQGQTELSMDHVLSDHTVAGAYESAADYTFTCNRIYRNTGHQDPAGRDRFQGKCFYRKRRILRYWSSGGAPSD